MKTVTGVANHVSLGVTECDCQRRQVNEKGAENKANIIANKLTLAEFGYSQRETEQRDRFCA